MRSTATVALLLFALLPRLVQADDETRDARQRIIARQKALSNVTVLYQRADRFNPRADIPKRRPIASGEIVQLTEPAEFRANFRYFRGRAMYSRERLGPNKDFPFKRLVYAIADDRQETLEESASVEGNIERSRRLPAREYIDIALGLRAYRADDWLSPDVLQNAKLIKHKEGRVSLTWIVGAAEDIYYFDPKVEYALVEFVRKHGEMVSARIQNSDFRRVGALFLPYKSVHQEYRHDGGQETTTQRVMMNVVEYKLDDERNATDDFHIEWPLGSTVSHEKRGLTVRVKSRPQKLDEKIFTQPAG
jgi:hypothetical protein